MIINPEQFPTYQTLFPVQTTQTTSVKYTKKLIKNTVMKSLVHSLSLFILYSF